MVAKAVLLRMKLVKTSAMDSNVAVLAIFVVLFRIMLSFWEIKKMRRSCDGSRTGHNPPLHHQNLAFYLRDILG